MHLTITQPGSLLSVVVDRDIDDALARQIIEMLRANDVIADDNEVIPEAEQRALDGNR